MISSVNQIITSLKFFDIVFDLGGDCRDLGGMFEFADTCDDHGKGEAEEPVCGFPSLSVRLLITAGSEVFTAEKHVSYHLEIGQDFFADDLYPVFLNDKDIIITPYMADKTSLPGCLVNHVNQDTGNHQDNIITLGKTVTVIVWFEIVNIHITDPVRFVTINGSLNGPQNRGVARQFA